MRRNILDTNVLVSALIQHSYPFLIVYNSFIGGEFELCVSDMLLKEYYEVLARPKFTRYPDFTAKANALLADIASKALNFTPQETLSVIADDADNRLLELADEAQADYIITGNTNHFNFPQFHDTKIITPKDYWLLGANPEGSKI